MDQTQHLDKKGDWSSEPITGAMIDSDRMDPRNIERSAVKAWIGGGKGFLIKEKEHHDLQSILSWEEADEIDLWKILGS